MATGAGDWLEIRVTHPTLGPHTFYPKANEGNNFDKGGIRTNDDASQIAGSGEMIYQMNQVRGSLEITCADDANVRKDSDFANALSASPVEASWVCSHINGSTWGFNGKPVGDIVTDTNAGTFAMKLAFANAKKIN